MIRLLPFSIIIQAFCLYHAYKNKADQKWYWLILFFPVVGSLIYLYDHFYNRENVDKVSTGLKSVLNTNYELDQLEKAVKFSDSVQNKTKLADKYVKLNRYDEALELYHSCLNGFNSKDPKTLRKVLFVNYLKKDYPSCVEYGERLGTNHDFQSSEERICLAWSYHYLKRSEEAVREFEDMDRSFSNFPHRLEFAKFLQHEGNSKEAMAKLDELTDEYDQLGSAERRNKKWLPKAIKQVRTSFS